MRWRASETQVMSERRPVRSMEDRIRGCRAMALGRRSEERRIVEDAILPREDGFGGRLGRRAALLEKEGHDLSLFVAEGSAGSHSLIKDVSRD